MKNIKRFDKKGEIYQKARPKYAPALFEYMKSVLKIPEGSVFADIGSGTGIFTEQLISCGYRVYAVEPNADMRRRAELRLSHKEGFISVNGTDANTNLVGESVDYISVAQAFHWFDTEAFKKECKRILRAEGKIFIAYNSRDESAEQTLALAALRRKYNPDFHGFSNGISDKECVGFFGGKCEVFKADNAQTYDKESYINRVLSSSYSLTADDGRYNGYLSDIGAIFDRYEKDGFIHVPVHTVAYIGDLR